MRTQPTDPGPEPGGAQGGTAQDVHHQRRFFNRRVLLLPVLALCIIGGSAGFLAFTRANQIALVHRDAAASSYAQRLATAWTTVENLYPPFGGVLAINDPLGNNSRGYHWAVGPGTVSTACAFHDGAYHASVSQPSTLLFCPSRSSDFSDFTYQVQMTIISGDQGGIGFRVDTTQNPPPLAYFRISTTGQYWFDVYTGSPRTLSSGLSPAIHMGLNQPNLLAVVARGSTIDLYINLIHIATVMDSSASHGQIGVIANDISNATEVVFSNARVWTL
jgi:eukaryotic-like serine/threonine-protein kinase